MKKDLVSLFCNQYLTIGVVKLHGENTEGFLLSTCFFFKEYVFNVFFFCLLSSSIRYNQRAFSENKMFFYLFEYYGHAIVFFIIFLFIFCTHIFIGFMHAHTYLPPGTAMMPLWMYGMDGWREREKMKCLSNGNSG